jgi:hypothetical protein
MTDRRELRVFGQRIVEESNWDISTVGDGWAIAVSAAELLAVGVAGFWFNVKSSVHSDPEDVYCCSGFVGTAGIGTPNPINLPVQFTGSTSSMTSSGVGGIIRLPAEPEEANEDAGELGPPTGLLGPLVGIVPSASAIFMQGYGTALLIGYADNFWTSVARRLPSGLDLATLPLSMKYLALYWGTAITSNTLGLGLDVQVGCIYHIFNRNPKKKGEQWKINPVHLREFVNFMQHLTPG